MKVSYVLMAAVLALVVSAAARADFVVDGNNHRDIREAHVTGVAFDDSTVDVWQDGNISGIVYASDNAVFRVHEGSYVEKAWSYGDGSIELYGGHIRWLRMRETGIAMIQGGSVYSLISEKDSTVNILGDAWVQSFSVEDDSHAIVSGGAIEYYLRARNSSTVRISGGNISQIGAYDRGIIEVIGYDFRVISEYMDIDDNGKLSGIGAISGKWYGSGEAWIMGVQGNHEDAAILLIPEPATLSLLLCGGLAVMRRRRR